MRVALLAGMLCGVGAWAAVTGLRPVPEPLGVVLARINRRPSEAAPSDPSIARDLRIGRLLLRKVPVLARSVERLHSDLRIVGRSPEEHAARVGSQVALPLVLGPWVGFVAWVVGMRLPPLVPGFIVLVGAAWGMVGPFRSLARQAAERRQAFGHALSAWCDVVVMTLAAGRGVEQAMETAASAGRGWAFAELRGALQAGYVRGEPPWEALQALGAELGIPDVSELGNTIAMAGEEGAAVRETVAAKARTIRERITADTEVTAAAATERMSLPNVLLVAGFLVFLGYPAVTVMLQI